MNEPRKGSAVVLLAVVPILLLRLGVGLLRFASRRRRGVRRFRRALVAGGLNPAQATRLARMYQEAGSIRHILRAWAAAR